MSKKNVDDYLQEGIYGVRRPKEAERRKYLGTLRERIVLALTVGQVMQDACLIKLEEAMKEHKDAKLLINGQVAYRSRKEEINLANKHDISYTIISNEDYKTDIGAVLTYDYAVHMEEIFVKDDVEKGEEVESKEKASVFTKLKKWFKGT